jgi:hypothetical protein
MSKHLHNKYFVILNKDEIVFSCLNSENKISFKKSHSLINGPNNVLEELEYFFINNLIEIEKSLKDFIKNIYLIIDTDQSFSVNLSIKYKLGTEKINKDKINDLLSSLYYQFTKYSNDLKVIHMTINKLLIDGKEKDLSSVREIFDDLILEVKFECLKNQTVHHIKKLCSNYQISVDKILLANNLGNSIWPQTENIIHVAIRDIYCLNKNAIKIVKKKQYKKPFFERFFHFFN